MNETKMKHPPYSVVIVDNYGDGNGPRTQEASGDAGPIAAFLRRCADQMDPPKPVKPVLRATPVESPPLPGLPQGRPRAVWADHHKPGEPLQSAEDRAALRKVARDRAGGHA